MLGCGSDLADAERGGRGMKPSWGTGCYTSMGINLCSAISGELGKGILGMGQLLVLVTML